MIDPIELSKKIENDACKNISRKYYRFRKTRFYGGCATADCVGCNLRCIYCWAQKTVWKAKKYGTYYTPTEVSMKLIKMNLSQIRISGGEPTICKNHLLDIINRIPENKQFILETNGILLNEDYVISLSDFKNLHVRVSLKGVDEKTFKNITGVQGVYFKNQLKALELLEMYGVKHHAAILIDLFTNEQVESLRIPNLEHETLIEYPFIINNLKRKNIILQKTNQKNY